MIKINLVTNESLNFEKDDYFCNNIEIRTLVEGLNKRCFTQLFGRFSKKTKSHRILNRNIIYKKNIISFLISIYKEFKTERSIFLVVSLSPYTFLSIILLKIFKKKYVILLRSDGFKEYKKILGFFGPLIYKLIFSISTYNSKLISCGEHILRGKKGTIIRPSSLTNEWNKNTNKANFDQIKLLYVGRLRIEKGIFSLIKIIENIDKNIKLTIIGDDKKQKIPSNDRITYKGIINNEIELIKNYDENNIFILPSYTEGYSMVIDEALSRMRPVIIFNEIKNIIGKRKGIFSCKRNTKDLKDTINFISKNYDKILEEIRKNKFPNKNIFVEKIFKKVSEL